MVLSPFFTFTVFAFCLYISVKYLEAFLRYFCTIQVPHYYYYLPFLLLAN